MAEEFGEIIELAPENTPSFEEFGEVIEESPKGPKTPLQRMSAFIKDPQKFLSERLPEIKKELGKELKTAKGEVVGGVVKGIGDIFRAKPDVSIGMEAPIENLLDQLGIKDALKEKYEGLEASFPEGHLGQNITRRFVRSLPYAPNPLAFLGALEAEGGGVALKEVTKALGGGEEAQEKADVIGSLLGPTYSTGKAAFAKKLIPGKKTKGLVEGARKLGFSDKEITPLTQPEKKVAGLGWLAKKGEKTKKLFTDIKNTFEVSFDTIKKEAQQLPSLTLEENRNLLRNFHDVKRNLSKTLAASPDKENAIKFIDKAMESLRNKKANPETLINFWQDINNSVNWNSIRGGKKKLTELKEPLLKALKKSSLSLAEDFEINNQLYSNFKKISRKLKSDVIDKWFNKGEWGAAVTAIATMNPAAIKVALPAVSSRILARELLINPSFQNISKKLLHSVKQDNTKKAIALLKLMKRKLKQKYPDEEFDFGLEEKEEE